MNVSLTPKLDDFVGNQVKAGRYRSASEVVREALRMLETRQAETQHIQQALNEGLATNPIDGKDAMDRIRRNLQEKHGV
jgi:antitoxin ParD1/3/4